MERLRERVGDRVTLWRSQEQLPEEVFLLFLDNQFQEELTFSAKLWSIAWPLPLTN